MYKLLLFIVLIFPSFTLFSQITEVKNYSIHVMTTDISPKEALRKAVNEALSSCIQQKLGVSVIDLTNFQKTESNNTYKENFNDFMMQFSLGYVAGYEITDTIQNLKSGGVIETNLLMNIRLRQPQTEDPFGLYASANNSFFKNQDELTLSYSVKKTSYLYVFDMTWQDEVLLLMDSQEKLLANKNYIYPAEISAQKLVMEKEAKNEYEFGCMIVIATKNPVNFGISVLGSGDDSHNVLKVQRFFEQLNAIHGDYSIKYVPYCIE